MSLSAFSRGRKAWDISTLDSILSINFDLQLLPKILQYCHGATLLLLTGTYSRAYMLPIILHIIKYLLLEWSDRSCYTYL